MSPEALVAERDVDVGGAQRGPAASARRAMPRLRRGGERRPIRGHRPWKGPGAAAPERVKEDRTSLRVRTWSIGPLPGVSALNDESDNGLSGRRGEQLDIISGTIPVGRRVSARPKLKSGRLGLNNSRERLPSQSDVRRVPELRVPGEPSDERPSEITRPIP